MAKINLLPWREELRKQQLQSFLVVLAMVTMVAIVVSFGWQQSRERALETQNARNSYVEGQISQLDESIKELNQLQKRRDRLIEQTKVIQGLQGNRPTIVHVFDQFVETLQDGIFYTAITQKGDSFEVTGIAESNNRVSNMMRALESSEWFKNPQLSKVVAQGEMFVFSLSVQLEDSSGFAAPEAVSSGQVKKKGAGKRK